MLTRWSLQNYAMTVVDACAISRRDILDLNPPYQRGLVWTDEQRENLIRSLLEGIPCGIIYRNFRGYKHPVTYSIVDGKQRIDTVRRFYDGEMTVPADWFGKADLSVDYPSPGSSFRYPAKGDVDARGRVSYLGLSDQGQRLFDMSSLAVYETNQLSPAMEEVLYERVNYGGTPHEPKDAVLVVQDGTIYHDVADGIGHGADPTHQVVPLTTPPTGWLAQ